MKVILLQDVAKVGQRGDTKNVAAGFARNMLIRKKLAVPATPSNEARARKLQEARIRDGKAQEAEQRESVIKLDGGRITIKAKADEKGHLFAGIGETDLVAAIQRDLGVAVPVNALDIKKPIKELGEHEISASDGDAKSRFVVAIETEET